MSSNVLRIKEVLLKQNLDGAKRSLLHRVRRSKPVLACIIIKFFNHCIIT